jgi:hypothetical protein
MTSPEKDPENDAPLLERALPRAAFTTTHIVAALVLVACVATALAFAFNLHGLQQRACAGVPPQPQMSDACGALGLGGAPARAERVAWQQRAPGDCAALRAHVQSHPQGAFKAEAEKLLARKREMQQPAWVPVTRHMTLFVHHGDATHADEQAARAEALVRARQAAERLCGGFAASTPFRLVGAEAASPRYDCNTSKAGTGCGLEGEAVCRVEAWTMQTREVCAP